MTLKFEAPCVKETSQSSTARPQEKRKCRPLGEGTEQSDEAIQSVSIQQSLVCFASLAMTGKGRSMPALGLFHRLQLLGAGDALKLRFPGLIGHAVDRLAALV